jgi:hypothetical protein
MSLGVYLGVFAGVIAVDQLSKRWAVRALPSGDLVGSKVVSAWTRTTPPAFERLGRWGALMLWLLAGAAGAALCLEASRGAAAAVGGIAAWAAAASNIGESWTRGGAVDWLRLWPRSVSNVADAVLILGSAQLTIWIAVS